ncbi:MAG: 23S rRNA (uracil(1939)-C(5))-methyltransferase RlmD [Spirochaetales bacterium]|nr:23S rRNA (uracil(1939)-C(5))-methyltransferase RlmD [Spirochaetales bacterium]
MNTQPDEIQLSITGLGHDGEGVGRADNMVFFVAGALPGETVKAKIIEKKKSFYRAELLEITTPSLQRITPQCPYFNDCGGCQLQHMDYQSQLAFKTQRVRDAVSRIGKTDPSIVGQCIGMDHPWEYRNNIQYTTSKIGDNIYPGLLKRQSHDAIPIARCLLVSEDIDLLAGAVCAAAAEVLSGKDSNPAISFERIQIRKSFSGNNLMTILYSKFKPTASGERFAKILVNKIKGITPEIVVTGIINCVTDTSGRITQEITLHGSNSITETVSCLAFTIQAQSFFQVNTIQAERLFETAVSLIREKHTTAIDAFCGTGSLALFFARKGMTVVGIESNPSAVKDAIQNSKANNLPKARFKTGSFSRLFPDIVKKYQPSLLIADPPRSGIGQRDLTGMRNTSIQEIVYISCDPETLARDIGYLGKEGFSPESIIPVDMFPQTAHVETISIFKRV